jgi:hypothetical protein
MSGVTASVVPASRTAIMARRIALDFDGVAAPFRVVLIITQTRTHVPFDNVTNPSVWACQNQQTSNRKRCADRVESAPLS